MSEDSIVTRVIEGGERSGNIAEEDMFAPNPAGYGETLVARKGHPIPEGLEDRVAEERKRLSPEADKAVSARETESTAEKPLSRMTKNELLAAARERGVDVDDGATAAELRDALEG